mgnify:FL=1
MMKNRILCYVCLFASFVVSSISIQTSMEAGSSGKVPNVWLHMFEFFVAVFLVALAIYFKYKSSQDKDRQL